MSVENEDIVSAFYTKILLRDPDVAGYSAHVSNLASGTVGFGPLLDAFLTGEEFRANFQKFMRTYNTNDLRFTNDHSQHGEFLEILKLILEFGADNRIVVDVGANGKERSNSYDLLKEFGWQGLLIEANPALSDQIRADFDGLNFSLVSVAVSDEVGTGTLSLGINSDISSLSPENTTCWGPITGGVTVPVQRLPNILRQYDIPHVFDLLSLDIEGYDARVLNDLVLNSAYRPRFVIIEGSHNFTITDPGQIGVSALVCEQYELSARTAANLILSGKVVTQARRAG
jgi:FkbM family methyltransferase